MHADIMLLITIWPKGSDDASTQHPPKSTNGCEALVLDELNLRRQTRDNQQKQSRMRSSVGQMTRGS